MKAAESENTCDILVIGAGLGGLLCGALLARDGRQVIVLEKNKQIGGNLQSFAVDGKLFESAVHYIGSLQKGQTLHKIFNYLGIADKISLKRLDESCFDEIILGGKSYSMAQGYENFINSLAEKFPHQKSNLVNYIREIKTVCSHFPLYNMRLGSVSEKNKVSHFGLKQKLDELISDETLKQILAGNNLLYAGDADTTPFFIHALIENSYIESSWKCEMGSIQIAKQLQQIIQNHGGQVLRNMDVSSIHEENGKIVSVETTKNKKFLPGFVISNLHPAATYSLLNSKVIKPVTKKRIAATPNTSSALMVNISLHDEMIPYCNHNIYYHKKPNVWLDLQYPNDESPNSYAVFFYQDQKHKKFARGLSILSYMSLQSFSEWEHTFNTTSEKKQRGDTYLKRKQALSAKFIDEIETIIPGLKDAVKTVDVCTPLSYRDYLNIPDGSMYGLKKNVNDLANTTFSPRTKISNLFLTGQNINLHGILGVSITALLTVGEMTDLEKWIVRINDYNK
jgi:all-trans-retinol 13,14-reductase